MNKRLEQLKKKRDLLNAQIQKVKQREAHKQNKEDTRRKILLGALLMEMMKKGEVDEAVIMKRLDGFLNRDIDRRLFDLPVLAACATTTESESNSVAAVAFEVILESVPSESKIAIIKKIRSVTGLGLVEARQLVDKTPTLLKKVPTEIEAKQIQKQFVDAGVNVIVKVVDE